MNDMVNHPPHYRWLPNGIEVIDITENMPFNLGNVVKYVLRCDHKGKPVEDLEKARWYLDREIQRRRSTAHPVTEIEVPRPIEDAGPGLGHNRRRVMAISPEGVTYEYPSLTDLCMTHNLPLGAMSKVANGRRPHYRQWSAVYVD